MQKEWIHTIVGFGVPTEECRFTLDDIKKISDNEWECKCGTKITLEDINYPAGEGEENPFVEDVYPARLLQ